MFGKIETDVPEHFIDTAPYIVGINHLCPNLCLCSLIHNAADSMYFTYISH